MSASFSDPTANNTQLVRYSLELPAMTTPESIVAVREVLQAQNLVVDQITEGQAHVASATGTEPDWPTIKQALIDAGFPVTHTHTIDD
ncbi:hypothetical protein [Hymenobacter cellulosilyticus]|uniref:HMA domain-containing protein n=1 Tax=Hymenobacter cellulosilyticus TaxID=2932248 RepID=A0A8T9Q332_9BACT|nr:hypothetical protein [Hymenobacter cellulosilyticus]UOQ71445.1 hypothetical protein MUN79_22950 [Hymenobacter cellulosilyticus]